MFWQATKVVRFELLEMVKRDWPAASTTTELRIFDLPQGRLNLTDGRSLRCAVTVLTRVAVGEAGGDGIGP